MRPNIYYCPICGIIIWTEDDDVGLYEGEYAHAKCISKTIQPILSIPLPDSAYSKGKKLPTCMYVNKKDLLKEAGRIFESGATRDKDETKLDFEGFLSPRVIKAFAEYMHKNREMRDGSVRASDNWQKGIPFDSYMKSAWRHFFDWWAEHRGLYSRDGLTNALCGLLFNVSGYLHEHLKRIENENKNI